MAKKTQSGAAGRARRKTSAKRPRNHRGLARAIFKTRDAVTVGRELLDSESATVKARVWETLVTYSLGEFAPAGGGPGAGGSVRIVWDLPGPPHETHAVKTE